MKKSLVFFALVAALSLPAAKAHASAMITTAASSSGGTTAAIFLSGVVGETALIYAIVSGVDPWSPVFPSVSYTYPTGANGQ